MADGLVGRHEDERIDIGLHALAKTGSRQEWDGQPAGGRAKCRKGKRAGDLVDR